MKKILYFDMDNVLVDFPSAFQHLDPKTMEEYKGRLDEVPNIFGLMQPMPMAIEAFEQLSQQFNSYILSTAPWDNPSAWQDKVKWVKKYLGQVAHKRLILSHNKHLNMGDYLIDDRTKNGAAEFKGEHILFGGEDFPDWPTVLDYLSDKA